MKKLLLRSFAFGVFFTCATVTYSQTTPETISANLSSNSQVAEFSMDASRGTPSLIKLDQKDPLQVNEVPAFLAEVLGTGQETSFVNESSLATNGLEVYKFQQYTNGIKVEHGVFKAISKNGNVQALTAEYYALPASISSSAGLSEAGALQKAIDFIGATTYAWELVESLQDSPEKTAALEEVYPKGELVFVDNYATKAIDLRLAYKFNIYAAAPLSRDDVYVDANTGEILLKDAIIKHASGKHTSREVIATAKKSAEAVSKKANSSPVFLGGTGDTRYAGTRSFDTSQDANGNYVLKGVTPSGVENETLSYEGIGGLPLSIPALASLASPIIDGDGDLLNPETGDNVWNASEHRKDEFSTLSFYPIANEKNNDDVALDAHWGAEIVLDYWKQKHNRLSYDNKGTKIFNYVHYGDAYDNAFWNGTAMTYGDGSYQGGTNPNGSFAPLTSMDVCAHEIGHGVCEFTADLVYARESGAMNEGFSDIWAAAAEYYVLTEIDGSLEYDPWGIGEQIDESDGGLPAGHADSRALRWMDDPKAEGAPDSYGGENWKDPECDTPSLANDQCGVHTNSGVLNKWYYFLVSGSGQAFSPGFQKQSADDQVTDAGNSYSVEGIGFEKASQIAYLAETMLSPNAKFAEMRAASILVAQTLYGISSREEQATTNAWHAVDVGEAYKTGDPNTISFSAKNVQLFEENNEVTGCEDLNTYSLLIEGVEIDPAASISISTAGSTATYGEDFELSATQFTFTGTESKILTLSVYDDAVIEGSETIVLSFIYNGELIKQEYAIADDDFVPRTGSEPFELLAEDFSSTGFSPGWTTVSLADGVNEWRANGNLSAAGRAYITDGLLETPFYDQNSPSHTILRSPLLNAAGATQVTVSFDWEAGGETDAVDPAVIFDYGEFIYSLDGTTYTPVEKFVGGGVLGTETASGSYNAIFEALDGKSFYLGWRWFNDTNAGSQFSFAIDNVKVTALPAGIETQANEQATAAVNVGNTVYFLSNTDKALIGKIENASADLGCVTLSVTEAGTAAVTFSGIASERPSKVFNITTSNADATYDLTLYFTDEELSAFAVPTDLVPIKVNSSNIDDANENLGNFQLNGVLTDVNAEDKYHAYTGTFSGSGSLSVVTDFEYCEAVPEPWKTVDVGTVNIPGTLCYSEGNFELTAQGNDLSGRGDNFYFTYQKISGDTEVIARVTGLENTNVNAQAAVMIRESLDPDAEFALTSINAGSLLSGHTSTFRYRKTTGARASMTSGNSAAIPEYIRIVRKGKDVSSYVSGGNGNWRLVGSSKMNLSETLYVGIAATSATTGTSTVASFEEVTVTGTAANTQEQVTLQQETGTQDNSTAAFEMFPNPVVSVLNVHIADKLIRKLAIYNYNGKLLKMSSYPAGGHEEQISVDGLINGVYVLKLHTADGAVYDGRFVKE
ncbi:M4 family metallopeptidase [Salinimicrobium oceani]|uniref:T9SS type A sorting domain-containing protein n=2 Tax=Flavobacteriaceae TaxID=49546 RepID=A0ABX1CUI9_9FLAO|nr:M4 family metallopeptidase [Salinimicrobium oceani]NJW51949.1 T9SS type A sorting domain-containing protein [Salinimicrobium oceani]